MVLQLIIAFLVSLVVTVVAGLVLIPVLRRMKAGQTIREDGPVWHKNKEGTPTMGGLMFIAGVTISCLIAAIGFLRDGFYSNLSALLFALLLALVFAAIGFLDDYAKLKKKQNLGLKAKQKFILQLVMSAGFLLLMWVTGNLTTDMYIPFVNVYVSVPAPVYFVFAAFVAVATVNAVNITDGIDGLATGVSIPVAVFFVYVSFLWGIETVGVFAAALVGGLFAFLIFNFHPARVFMGDTGSLFLGGMIFAMALSMDMPLILIPLGIVYFVETLSDIIQVTYFKLTHGKRVFKMAPIHHHFEMCGWNEYKLFVVFTSVSIVFAGISYFGVMLRV